MKCGNCGEPFKPSMRTQRFCSRWCSDAWFQRERREAVKAFRSAQNPTSDLNEGTEDDDARGVGRGHNAALG
jgi:hypothetical protein